MAIKSEKQYDQESYDNWINDLLKNCPDSWDSDESAEAIVTEYVHVLEERLKSLGGLIMLEKYVMIENIKDPHLQNLLLKDF